MKVICISDRWKYDSNYLKQDIETQHPQMDGIYTVEGIEEEFYLLEEFPHTAYSMDAFRELDYGFVEEVIKMCNQRPIKIN